MLRIRKWANAIVAREINLKGKKNSHATNLESSQYLINSEDTVAVDDLRKQEKIEKKEKPV